MKAELKVELEKLKSDWQSVLGPHPILQLDHTWPSMGVVDALLFSLRGLSEYDERGAGLLRCGALMLAELVERCWADFGAQVSVDTNPGVTITAQGGEFLTQGERVEIQLEADLQQILTSVRNPFPVLGKFLRPVSIDTPMLPLYGIGVCTGRSPFGENPWFEIQDKYFEPYLQKVTKTLAKSSADWFKRVFPEDPLTHVAELYLHSLVYPPTMMAETMPGLKAVEGLLEFAGEYQLKPPALKKLGECFAQSPDELLCGAGLALCGALSEDEVDAEILAVSERLGQYAGLLRPAMLKVRADLGLGGDWIAKAALNEADIRRYLLEVKFGFLPWVKINARRLQSCAKENDLRELLTACVEFDLQRGIRAADEILTNSPADIAVRLQRIYFDVISGDIEKAALSYKALSSEPSVERDALFYNFWGVCDLLREDADAALTHFERAHKLMNRNAPQELIIGNNYAWGLLIAERFEDARKILEYIIPLEACPLTSLLNLLYVEQVGKRTERVAQLQKMIYDLAPLDRRLLAGRIGL